jgi:hypothetical protein
MFDREAPEQTDLIVRDMAVTTFGGPVLVQEEPNLITQRDVMRSQLEVHIHTLVGIRTEVHIVYY